MVFAVLSSIVGGCSSRRASSPAAASTQPVTQPVKTGQTDPAPVSRLSQAMSFSCEPPLQQTRSGASVSIEAIFKNIGSTKIYSNDGFAYPTGFAYRVTRDDGPELHPVNTKITLIGQCSLRWGSATDMAIAVGDSHRTRIPKSDLFDLRPPGRYKITLSTAGSWPRVEPEAITVIVIVTS
jgi:hypothetical protein